MIIKYKGIDGCIYILEGVSNIKIYNGSYKEYECSQIFKFCKSGLKTVDRLVNCIKPYDGNCSIIEMTQSGKDYFFIVRGEASICTDAGIVLESVFNQ